ncbi:unnamed protein product, partial [Didymodactylos carnosus]
MATGGQHSNIIYVWLDAYINQQELSFKLQKLLNGKFKNVKAFENMSDCKKRLLKEIAQVCTEIKELTEALVKQPPKNLDIPSTPPKNSNSELLNDDLWFRLLIEVLIRMNDDLDGEAKNDLLHLWRKEYGGDKKEQKIIEEFEREFEPSCAVHWFIRECRLYKLLDNALRLMDFDNIYALRFIIKYIHKQLKNHSFRDELIQSSPNLTLYRAKTIPATELEQLTTNIGQLQSLKSFLSSTSDRDMALRFLQHSKPSSDTVSVLFEIRIDTRLLLLPYANVSSLRSEEEEEWLFMPGTIYQMDCIQNDSNHQLRILKMSLCGEDDTRLKYMVDYLKYEMKETTDLISLANLFVKMGEYDMAKVYYHKYQNYLSNNDPNIKCAWDGLSQLSDIKGNYSIAMKNYKEARKYFNEQLKLCQNLPDHHPSSGKCYANFANLYEIEGKKQRALKYYQRAVDIYHQALPPYHPDITRIENCIENIMP